jgi:hypothetical protein
MHRRDLLRLLGGAITIPALAGFSSERLLALGQATHARTAAGVRHGLSAHVSDTIASIAELILPESDTPGAAAAGVPEFINLIVAEWQTEEERGNLMTGLEDLDRRSHDAGADTFLALTPDAQRQLLIALDAGKGAADSAESSVGTLKSLAVFGYFTSERIMTDVLKTPMIPGRYDGCAPLHTQ